VRLVLVVLNVANGLMRRQKEPHILEGSLNWDVPYSILRFSGAGSYKDTPFGLVMTRQWQWGALFFYSLSFAGAISRKRHDLRPRGTRTRDAQATLPPL
jgi:hypothetical protein